MKYHNVKFYLPLRYPCVAQLLNLLFKNRRTLSGNKVDLGGLCRSGTVLPSYHDPTINKKLIRSVQAAITILLNKAITNMNQGTLPGHILDLGIQKIGILQRPRIQTAIHY